MSFLKKLHKEILFYTQWSIDGARSHRSCRLISAKDKSPRCSLVETYTLYF